MSQTKEYDYGQQAFEQGKSFLDNPFHSWYEPEKFFSWSKGWWDKEHYYANLSRQRFIKEDEEFNRIFHEEQERKQKEKEVKEAEEKFKKSKKGKAEAAGQTSLFG